MNTANNTVLVVDDSIFMRQKVLQALEAAGYEVVAEAENGAQAVEMYQQYQPDLVTMDIVMPEMDGVEGLRQIKAINPHACVIMVSPIGAEQQVKAAAEAGASNFVLKPFDAAVLVKQAKSALANIAA